MDCFGLPQNVCVLAEDVSQPQALRNWSRRPCWSAPSRRTPRSRREPGRSRPAPASPLHQDRTGNSWRESHGAEQRNPKDYHGKTCRGSLRDETSLDPVDQHHHKPDEVVERVGRREQLVLCDRHLYALGHTPEDKQRSSGNKPLRQRLQYSPGLTNEAADGDSFETTGRQRRRVNCCSSRGRAIRPKRILPWRYNPRRS